MQVSIADSPNLPDSLPRLQPAVFDSHATNNAENLKTEKFQSRRTELVICLCLYIILILFHVALFIVWAIGAERRMKTSLDLHGLIVISSESLLNGCLQASYVFLTTTIIFLTQSIALGRQISRSQTLTALADRTTAWGGLGPSGVTLWNNIKIPAALASTVVICGYFATLAALQMTTPILFSLVLTNVTTERVLNTTVGTPFLFNTSYISNALPEGWELQGINNTSLDWFSPGSVLDVLGSTFSLSSPGLKDNRIYDTLVTTLPSNGTALVNYTDFHVTCGSISSPNVTWTPLPVVQLDPASDQIFLPVYFSIAVDINSVPINVSDQLWYNLNSTDPSIDYWIPSDVLIRVPFMETSLNDVGPPGRNLIIYSVYDEGGNKSGPIHDSAGDFGRSVTINITSPELPSSTYYPLTIQVIGCSMSTTNGNVSIHVTNNEQVEEQPTMWNLNRTWKSWEPQQSSSNVLEDYWGDIFDPSNSNNIIPELSLLSAYRWHCPQDRSTSCHQPTTSEEYLTDVVFGKSDLGTETWDHSSSYRSSFSNSTLEKLENALSTGTAMIYWAAGRSGSLRAFSTVTNGSITDNFVVNGKIQYGQANANVTNLVNEVQLRIIPLSIGALASVILFALALVLLRPSWSFIIGKGTHNPPVIDSLGLLETVRLMEGTPLHRQLVSSRPTDKRGLREAAATVNVEVIHDRLVEVLPKRDSGVSQRSSDTIVEKDAGRGGVPS